jgi:hypothetical protein
MPLALQGWTVGGSYVSEKEMHMMRALVACLLGMTCVAAQAVTNCHHVGGTISTNFLDASTTFGTATGDLAGAIGVSVVGFVPNNDGSVTFQNQHHWVTSTGDTINAEPANAVGYPSAVTGLYATIYPNGVTIAGGTGKFEGANGTLSSWGAVNLATGEVVLRYEGKVCYANGK